VKLNAPTPFPAPSPAESGKREREKPRHNQFQKLMGPIGLFSEAGLPE